MVKLSYTFNCLVCFSHRPCLIFSNLVLLFVVCTAGTTANHKLRFNCSDGNKISFRTSEASAKPAKQRASQKNGTIFFWPQYHLTKCQTINCSKKLKIYSITFMLLIKLFFSTHRFIDFNHKLA